MRKDNQTLRQWTFSCLCKALKLSNTIITTVQEYDPELAKKTLGGEPATATGKAEAGNRQLLVELVSARAVKLWYYNEFSTCYCGCVRNKEYLRLAKSCIPAC